MTAPLIVTDDTDLLDELLRLAAAAGITPTLARDPAGALAAWRTAPLVLVGHDQADPLARAAPGRREGVLVTSVGRADSLVYPAALALGAESVIDTRAAEGWLIERLGDVAEPPGAPARVIGVIGGSGGAGCSTFAAALATVSATSGPTLLVDCDPHGAGLDRVLGLELIEGVRWDALERTSGRMSGRALRLSVPRRGDLGVLTWHSTSGASLQPFAIRDVLAAAGRGHATVVLDLPRGGGSLVDELVARVDDVVLVVVPTVVGVASAARVASRLPRDRLRAVVRGAGAGADQVAALTGSRLVTAMGQQRGLDEAIDLGAGPLRSRRGPLAKAAAAVLASAP